MGIFSKLTPKAMTTHELARAILGYGGSTTAGIAVNSDSAMRAMCVHSCVKVLANSVAQLPCHLMESRDGSRRKATEHRLYTLLHDQPNAWMTAPEFWGMAVAHIKLRGNFFVLKTFDREGNIVELIPLTADSVVEVIQEPDFGLVYKVRRPTKDGSNIIDLIPSQYIMHIRGLVLNGYMGINPVQYARESIGLALAMEKHGAKLFAHGTLLGGILKWDKHFSSEEKARQVIQSFNEVYSSVENAHKTALLEDGMTWEKIQMTAEDSQFLESRNYQKKEIVDLFFGLPLSLMQSGDKVATYASAEQFSQEYVKYALMPLLVNFEKAIWRDLLNKNEKKTYYAKFSVGGLLRGDVRTRYAAYAIAIDKEIMSPNEVRELEDMNPYDGGDTYRTRTSTIREQEGEEK